MQAMTYKGRWALIIYLIVFLAVVGAVWRAYFSIAEKSGTSKFISQFVWLPLAVTILIRILVIPYITVVKGQLNINNEFFFTESFEVTKLVKVELSSSAFGKSYFILENYIRYDFNSFYLSESSLKELIQKLDKPVVSV